jgi:dephospho-CoA kinase
MNGKNHGSSLEASLLIIGFTGAIGSGCSFIAEGIQQILGDKCKYYRISDVLREEARKAGKDPGSVSVLQDIGDEYRAKRGLAILAELCLSRIKEDDARECFSQDDESIVLVDGIKNAGEAKYFSGFPNFYLMSVQADRARRRERLVGAAAKRFETGEEFGEADQRDEGENTPHGQQVKECNYLADVILDNDM